MKIRRRKLPDGWYPASRAGIGNLLDEWRITGAEGRALAGVVPHAGWTFCGAKIAAVLESLPTDVDTIVVLGGHNPPGGRLVSYVEDAWELPYGVLERDTEFAEGVERRVDESYVCVPEHATDNTVEVVMPLVGAIHRGVRWTAWRVPSDARALDFGRALAAESDATGRRVAVVGSTDLTHFGENYGFRPPESLYDPVGWVEHRDRLFLEALVTRNGLESLRLANEERTACSAGGAVAAMEFATARGSADGRLLGYSTSRDVYPSSSFVGYGAVIWETA